MVTDYFRAIQSVAASIGICSPGQLKITGTIGFQWNFKKLGDGFQFVLSSNKSHNSLFFVSHVHLSIYHVFYIYIYIIIVLYIHDIHVYVHIYIYICM